MKKIMVMLLSVVMLLLFAGSAFAADPAEAEPVGGKIGELRYEVLKEFNEEFHTINSLKIERADLRKQVIENHDKIIDLYVNAWESGNMQALQEARETAKDIKSIDREIRETAGLIREEKQAFRQDIKNNDFEAAEEHIEEVINLKELINNKISQKVELLEKVIEILT